MREIIFVIGMHRTATSAFTGSLALLGATLPTRMLAASSSNPKGCFESEAVVAANDRLLEGMQRRWNDCRPLTQPEGPPRQSAEDYFVQLLRTDFGCGPIIALKDPRVSLLTPVWIDAARRIGARPGFVIMLRHPMASATSLIRRDGLDEEAAIALWLRYIFDAEHHSRGHSRTIVCAEGFMHDPVATLERVGAALGLDWPTAPAAVHDGLTAFLDAELLDSSRDMTTPLADLACEVHTALADLAGVQDADETAARRRIDALRADFDAMCPEIHERMVFDQLGKAVTRKWEANDVHGRMRTRAAQRDQSQKQAVPSIVVRDAAVAEGATTVVGRDATDKIQVALERRIQTVEAERETAVRAMVQAQTDLARARRRPGRVWRDLIKFQVLTGLSKARPFLPDSMTRRFARSAAKCDPNRFLPGDAARHTGPDAKDTLRQSLEGQLETFLRSGERLHLPRMDHPKVSIILVLWNQAALTLACLRSIETEFRVPLEVIIIDNGSTDQTAALLSQTENAKVLVQAENLGFLKAVNLGLRTARGDHVLLLNNDAVLRSGALAASVDTLESAQDIGAVGGRIILPNGRLQEAGSIIWADGSCKGYGRDDDPMRGQYMFRRDVDYCSGAFLLVNGRVFRDLNGLDEAYVPAYYEETDLCMRLRRAGYRTVFDPNVVIDHFEFGSSEKLSSALDLQRRNREIFCRKHAAALAAHLPAKPSGILHARMRDERRRLLHIDDQVPIISRGAGLPRTQEILRILSNGGYFVTYFPSKADNASWAEIRGSVPDGVEVALGHGLPQLEAFLEGRIGYYDAIFISRPHNMAALARIKAERPELLSGVRIVYDAEALFAARDRIKAEILEDVRSLAHAKKAIVEELNLATQADHVTTVSPTEASEFSKVVGGNVSILGHFMEPTPTRAPFNERDQILFLGRLIEDESPNVDSLVWFVDEVLPILRHLIPLHEKIIVAGQSTAARIQARAENGLKLLGPVSDLHATFERARVFIAPTRFAAGIPHKVHQAAAMGVPVVTTSLLAHQLGWKNYDSLLAADTPKDFANSIASVYQDEELWNRLRTSALSRIKVDCAPARFRHILLSAVSNDTSSIDIEG